MLISKGPTSVGSVRLILQQRAETACPAVLPNRGLHLHKSICTTDCQGCRSEQSVPEHVSDQKSTLFLRRPCNPNAMVTAANFANMPTYNAQCGVCLKVTNLEGSGQLYLTVIDYKGDPGKL